MWFQHRFETFHGQFRNSNVLGQWVPNNRSGDAETSRPKATDLGSRHIQPVAPHSRPQISLHGVNLPNRIAVAAEVSRTSTMDGIANRKPVELVFQHRSDMVELLLVRDQPGSRIEDRLKLPHNNVCGTVKNDVAVVDTTWYERMDQCFGGIRGEWSSDGSQLSQLIETASSDVVHMHVHSQFTVESHAEILDEGRRFDTVFTNCQGLWIQATKIESCRSSASADLTSFIPRLFQCTPSPAPQTEISDLNLNSRLFSGVAWASPKVGPHYQIFFAFFVDIWDPMRISFKFMTLYTELLMKVSINHCILDKIQQWIVYKLW